MNLRPQDFWDTVLKTIDVAILNLGHALTTEEGGDFICALGPGEAELCLELLERVCRCLSFSRRSSERVAGSSGSFPRRKVEESISLRID